MTRWRSLPWAAVAACAGTLSLAAIGMIVFSRIFYSSRTIECANGFPTVPAPYSAAMTGANAAAIVYGATLLVLVPLATLMMIITRRWRFIPLFVALFVAAWVAAAPLYNAMPAYTIGQAKGCT